MSVTGMTGGENHEKYFGNTAATHFQRRRAGMVRVGDQKREQGRIFLHDSVLSDAAESRLQHEQLKHRSFFLTGYSWQHLAAFSSSFWGSNRRPKC